MKKKYLILGGNGFIGQNLCKFLCKQHEDVTVFDRNLPVERQNEACYLQGDFFNDNNLKEALLDKDIIVHAISTINPGNSEAKYLQGYEKDFVQTIKLCKLAVENKKKIIFLSSGGTVYGNQKVQPLSEVSFVNPINHYGNIKLCIENTMRVFKMQNDLDVIIARISNPYGIGQDSTKGVGFIDAVLKNSIRGVTTEIWGDGSNIRDYIYIDDVCSCLYKLSWYQGQETTFNVSSGIGVSQNEIVSIVRELGFDTKIVYKERRSIDVKNVTLDNQKICKIFHFKPTSLYNGIKKYADYLLNNY